VLEIGQTVQVKVLDIDRDRQRISLGLKQTQSDPWQQVLEQHKEGDVVEGRVTKVVTFGAFVEILPGVEGLVHISELAQHHVENPREVVAQGDTVPVLILEVDAERRRLSLSLKRVDADRRTENEPPLEGTPHLDLSEDVFSDSASAAPAPPLEEDASLETPAGAEDAVEREAVNVGDELDPAAADEVAPVESVPDEH
jgi:small subunit ribosomal protein S1